MDVVGRSKYDMAQEDLVIELNSSLTKFPPKSTSKDIADELTYCEKVIKDYTEPLDYSADSDTRVGQ